MIDVKKILGSKFKEDMTIDELVSLLAEDESMVSASEYQTVKGQVDKYSRQISDYKKQLNANKSSEEQVAEQIDSLTKTNNELLKKLSIMENEKSFISLGYDENSAHEIATAMEDGDMKKFFKLQTTFNESQKKAIKEAALKNTKLPDGGGTQPKQMTKKEFSKLSLDAQNKFAIDNPEAYREMYKQEE